MSLRSILNKLTCGFCESECVDTNCKTKDNSLGGEFCEIMDIINRRIGRGMSLSTVISELLIRGWSAELIKIVPDASYLLIEANKIHEEKLREFKKMHANVDYVLAAASDKTGNIFFDASDPFGGAAYHSEDTGLITLPATDYIKEKGIQGPYLLKLDTHGFEVPISEGAKNALKTTNLIVVEMYNFLIENHSLLFHEMCKYLLSKGFRCIGIAEELIYINFTIFINGETDGELPPEQEYFLPNQVTDPGILLLIEHEPAMIRTPAVRESFSFVVTF
jgi:FkbM family methyltransferase